METKNRLFIGVYPCGLVYADRFVEENGDYKKIAFLSYRTLEVEYFGKCPDDLKDRIERSVSKMLENKGKPFHISQSQTIILGR